MIKPLLIAIAAVGAVATVQTVRLSHAQAQHAQAVAALATERANAAAQALRTTQTYRQLEGDHRAQLDQINTQASQRLTAAVADAGRARAARDGLQRDLADYLTQHRAAAQARAAAGNRTPDTTAADLLADLQRRADDRAGDLAQIADQARSRGTACEAAYDSARTMTEAAGAQPQPSQ